MHLQLVTLMNCLLYSNMYFLFVSIYQCQSQYKAGNSQIGWSQIIKFRELSNPNLFLKDKFKDSLKSSMSIWLYENGLSISAGADEGPRPINMGSCLNKTRPHINDRKFPLCLLCLNLKTYGSCLTFLCVLISAENPSISQSFMTESEK